MKLTTANYEKILDSKELVTLLKHSTSSENLKG